MSAFELYSNVTPFFFKRNQKEIIVSLAIFIKLITFQNSSFINNSITFYRNHFPSQILT